MNISRRSFLRSSAAASVATPACSAQLMLKPFRKMLNGDETCSLLVIGTGFAGLGAAPSKVIISE